MKIDSAISARRQERSLDAKAYIYQPVQPQSSQLTGPGLSAEWWGKGQAFAHTRFGVVLE